MLPTVQQGSIKLDLHRRDFTINTLALALNPDRWGQLLDFWGGLNDLRAGAVRVLHSLSFVDDPTRILRAVRYEQRFAFQIEPRTLELLADALELLDRVTPARVRHELERILDENIPDKALLRLDELGILRQIHPALRMDVEIEREFIHLRSLREASDADPILRETQLQLLYWAVLVYPLSADVHTELSARLGLRHDTARLMASMLLLRESLPLLAKQDARPSELVVVLDEIEPAALALAPVVCDDLQVLAAIARYRAIWQHVHAELNGDDLHRMGIPRGRFYRDILTALRTARLDGLVGSREDEERIVKKMIADA
ncbi:MAG: CCA tRNA nucleotidyltransferase [Anaerolineales bacterium]|nr:CCA tRNA nucleotidyltransferase [Anaerolineales bacterium]